jgi:hypothetical protein
MELSARPESYARKVPPLLVLRSHFAVSYRTGLMGFPYGHRRVTFQSPESNLSASLTLLQSVTRSTLVPNKFGTPLLDFAALQHLQLAESTTTGLYLPSGSAFRVWLPS